VEYLHRYIGFFWNTESDFCNRIKRIRIILFKRICKRGRTVWLYANVVIETDSCYGFDFSYAGEIKIIYGTAIVFYNNLHSVYRGQIWKGNLHTICSQSTGRSDMVYHI